MAPVRRSDPAKDQMLHGRRGASRATLSPIWFGESQSVALVYPPIGASAVREDKSMTYGKWTIQRFKAVLIWAAVCFASLGAAGLVTPVQAQDKPNILVIWGDDIGITNISAYSRGLMGYKTPNIDRIAEEALPDPGWRSGRQRCAGLR